MNLAVKAWGIFLFFSFILFTSACEPNLKHQIEYWSVGGATEIVITMRQNCLTLDLLLM